MTTKVKSLHVTLPIRLREYVDQQVKKEGYSTNSDYVQHLIRKEIELQEKKKLEKMLLEGLASGKKEYSQKEWDKFHNDIVKQYNN